MSCRLYGKLETTVFSLMNYLEGKVYGHPTFPDGSFVRVPDPTPFGDSRYLSSSGNYYELLHPEDEPCCDSVTA